MSQPLIDSAALLAGLETSGSKVVIVSTGGGSLAIPHLLTTPGASGVVLECLVPYAREAVDRLLGGPQESYCSSRTARRLAVMAWQRACGLGESPASAIGAAVTASLRSLTPKRGLHRIVVAVQSLGATSVATLVLDKNSRSRAEEETAAAALLLEQLASFSGAAGSLAATAGPVLHGDESVEIDRSEAPAPGRDLLSGTRTAVHASSDPSRPLPADATSTNDIPAPGMLVFPGSFDPLHEGHLRMAVVAQEIAKRPLDFELSVTNVDKPALDYLEMESRAAQFAGRSLWFTRAATFVQKLAIFPDATFVLGADTYARLADPKYYGGSAEAADQAVQRIATQARRLIVFGRERNGAFEDPAQLAAPPALRNMSTFVSQREFRMDISSTALRRQHESTD
jgi:nicotinic acid mononucleotide adenylyltransferase